MIRRKPKETEEAAAPATAAPQLPETVAALNERVDRLRERRKKITVEIRALEDAGVRSRAVEPRRKDAALALLTGDDVAGEIACSEPEVRLAVLHRERTVIDVALQMAGDRARMLDAAEGRARYEAHESEYRSAVLAVTRALLALEHELQSQDVVGRKIRVSYPLEFSHWPLAGRVENRDSQICRWLEIAVAKGIMSQSEFDAERNRALAAQHPLAAR
jgi:hypothetical protein